MVLAWSVLFVAIVIEVGATAALPRTESFTQPGWTVLVLGGYALSIWMLAVVVKHIPVAVTYAIWSGLGTAAIAGVGVLLLGDRMDWTKAFALLLIVVGVIVLNLHTAS